MRTVFVVCLLLAFAAGALFVWFLPGAWEWIKAFLHAVTAP